MQPDHAQAAQKFIDYLTSQPAQSVALLKYGFRPTLSSVGLDQPGSPFQQYADNGFKIDLPQQVAIPAGSVLNTLLDFWSRNVKR